MFFACCWKKCLLKQAFFAVFGVELRALSCLLWSGFHALFGPAFYKIVVQSCKDSYFLLFFIFWLDTCVLIYPTYVFDSFILALFVYTRFFLQLKISIKKTDISFFAVKGALFILTVHLVFFVY